MENIIIALGLITALSGCASTQVATQPVPSSFLQPCGALEPLAGVDGKAALTNIINNAEIYWDCKTKHQVLIDAVKVKQK